MPLPKSSTRSYGSVASSSGSRRSAGGSAGGNSSSSGAPARGAMARQNSKKIIPFENTEVGNQGGGGGDVSMDSPSVKTRKGCVACAFCGITFN